MLKLLSLNIEGDNHISDVLGFVREQDPDVVFFTECFEADVPLFKHSFDMEGFFVPAQKIEEPNDFRLDPRGNIGSLVLTKTKLISTRVDHYYGDQAAIPELTTQTPNAANRFLLWAEVEKDGQIYTLANTHFTVTKGGEPNDLQRENMRKVLDLLSGKEFVMCGDFNAPRGGEIFEMLASKYKDCIPAEIQTTLDRSLHRNGQSAGFNDFVVDGLFVSKGYEASNVKVICGISDHCAIAAQIRKSAS